MIIKKFNKVLFTKLFCCIGDENYPSLLEGLFFCGDERSDVSPKHAKQFRAAEKVPHQAGETGTRPSGRGAKLINIGDLQERNVFHSSI